MQRLWTKSFILMTLGLLFLFTAFYMPKRDIKAAIEACASRVFAVLEKTVKEGTREIQLVQSQEALINPPKIFSAEKVN